MATTVSRSSFGNLPGGAPVEMFTLQSGEVEVGLITYGARVVSLSTKDRAGQAADITFGHSTLDGYLTGPNAYLGATCGRYSNRIRGGQFVLDGKQYQLTVNNGTSSLHGGTVGFDRANWKATEVPNGVEFLHTSPDGDQGYPGACTVTVRYTLDGAHLRIDYTATTDRPTILNLTNHAYFNLEGEGTPSVLDHVLTLDADAFTPVTEAVVPTGEIAPVAGTPFDFTTPHVIGERIEQENEQLHRARGYDHNFVVRGQAGSLRRAARLACASNGRTLEVWTTELGVQFYSGNFLEGSLIGKSGRPYLKRSGMCLETQHFPDSPNHANFPSTVLEPGTPYTSTTEWIFGTEWCGL